MARHKPNPSDLPSIIFAVNAPFPYWQLHGACETRLFDGRPQVGMMGYQASLVFPAPCCGLPGQLFKSWFDEEQRLEADEHWQPVRATLPSSLPGLKKKVGGTG